jgi:hypothetical protein
VIDAVAGASLPRTHAADRFSRAISRWIVHSSRPGALRERTFALHFVRGAFGRNAAGLGAAQASRRVSPVQIVGLREPFHARSRSASLRAAARTMTLHRRGLA